MEKVLDGCVTSLLRVSFSDFEKEGDFDVPEIFHKISGNTEEITATVDMGDISNYSVNGKIQPLEEVIQNTGNSKTCGKTLETPISTIQSKPGGVGSELPQSQ